MKILRNGLETPPDDLAPSAAAGIVFGARSRAKQAFARKLRRDMTPQESAVWQRLRNGRLSGHHVRRQQVIDGFIVDFFCVVAALVVEIDGCVHDDQQEADERRDRVLEQRRLRVIRFANAEVDNALESVLDKILVAVNEQLEKFRETG